MVVLIETVNQTTFQIKTFPITVNSPRDLAHDIHGCFLHLSVGGGMVCTYMDCTKLHKRTQYIS